MTTERVLEIVAERGLRVVLVGDQPVLRRPNGNEGVTDALLAVLRRHREKIIASLRESAKKTEATNA